MSVVPFLGRQQVQEDCLSIASDLGAKMARTIMENAVMHELEPEQMEALVDEAVTGFTELLIEAGGDLHDVGIAADHYHRAIIDQGRHLARLMTWEAGQA